MFLMKNVCIVKIEEMVKINKLMAPRRQVDQNDLLDLASQLFYNILTI